MKNPTPVLYEGRDVVVLMDVDVLLVVEVLVVGLLVVVVLVVEVLVVEVLVVPGKLTPFPFLTLQTIPVGQISE